MKRECVWQKRTRNIWRGRRRGGDKNERLIELVKFEGRPTRAVEEWEFVEKPARRIYRHPVTKI